LNRQTGAKWALLTGFAIGLFCNEIIINHVGNFH
jgi:hypothetical protein